MDLFAKARIRSIIKKLNEEKGTTIFLTSHDTGDVEALCNRIIIINNGTLVMDSGINELKENYLTTKKMSISYENVILENNFKYPIKEVRDNKVELLLDKTKENIGDVLSYFTSIGNIADIQIESTPLEDVIKKIYKEFLYAIFLLGSCIYSK